MTFISTPITGAASATLIEPFANAKKQELNPIAPGLESTPIREDAMPAADPRTYLASIVEALKTHWPDNKTVNVACHGHSVPAGYFATPMVDTFNAYPHLLHRGLKQRFPFSVVNVIVTAIGGEHSEAGAGRFDDDVLTHDPNVVTIDYGLNDRRLGMERAGVAWVRMIEKAISMDTKVILLTPTPDTTLRKDGPEEDGLELRAHATQIRELAEEYGVGLVDSLAAFDAYQGNGDLSDLLSWGNHPNRAGHELVTKELLRWFPID